MGLRSTALNICMDIHRREGSNSEGHIPVGNISDSKGALRDAAHRQVRSHHKKQNMRPNACLDCRHHPVELNTSLRQPW